MTGASKPKLKRGRPTIYTQELAERLCVEVALCERPLAKICTDAGMPSLRTVFHWQRENEDFAKALALAREHRADARADMIHGYIGDVQRGELDPNSAKVMIDAQRWLASKEQPKKYADRVVGEHTVRAIPHTEPASDTAEWIRKVLAGDDRTNVIPLLPPKEPAA